MRMSLSMNKDQVLSSFSFVVNDFQIEIQVLMT